MAAVSIGRMYVLSVVRHHLEFYVGIMVRTIEFMCTITAKSVVNMTAMVGRMNLT